MIMPKFFIEKRAFFRSKVARRIFSLFILCALVPLGVLAYYSYNQVTGSLYAQATAGLRRASKISGMIAYERLQFLETDLETLASLPAWSADGPAVGLHSGLEERLSARFKGLVLRTGSGMTTSIVGRMRPIPQLTEEEEDQIRTGKTIVFSRPGTKKAAGIYMAKALDGRRPLRAFVFGEIDPEYLWEGEGFSSPLTEFFVIDQAGSVLFTSFNKFVPVEELKNALRRIHSVQSFTWTYGKDSYLASFWNLFIVPRFHANWIVVQSQSKKESLAPVGYFRKLFPLLVLLTFFIAVLLSLIQIRRNLVPIELLREATKHITA